MNILLSASSYPTEKTPFASFVGVIAREFSKRGHNVTVIAPQSVSSCIKNRIPIVRPHYSEKSIDNRIIEIYRPFSLTLGQAKYRRLSNIINRAIINLNLRLIKKKFDLVYSHFWWSSFNVADYVVKNNLPMFVACGEDKIDIHNYLSIDEIKIIKNNLCGVICVSSKNLNECEKACLLDDEPVLLAPNAVDANFSKIKDINITRKTLNISEDDFVVAFCGRFSSRKGVNRLDEALKQLNNKHIKAIYIGSSSEGEKPKLDYPGICFMGSVPHDLISSYLSCADVFVLPSLAEGCSNAIVEAMACGLPIISSNLPFNYDILDKSNSLLIDPNDVCAIASSIAFLAQNRNIAEEMGFQSKKKASSLTIEKRVDNILSFIKNNMKNSSL